MQYRQPIMAAYKTAIGRVHIAHPYHLPNKEVVFTPWCMMSSWGAPQSQKTRSKNSGFALSSHIEEVTCLYCRGKFQEWMDYQKIQPPMAFYCIDERCDCGLHKPWSFRKTKKILVKG